MNKQQLSEAVAASLGTSHTKGRAAVEAVLDTVTRALADGHAVSVTGFGTFEPVDTPARTARNPQTGDRMQLPASRKVRFRPGAALRGYVTGERPIPAGRVHKAGKGSASTQA
ncbi:HU family DNA-binding protein [Peterkaempfera griseoplana]|uniref:HU family DNA-binding protein n=1 Tax=Peterkaempfera griseoplana TaxID=66896 RepID=UPI0006E3DFFF|nr:HU family DNA-binding protein [Peterkaempfera griseoplana]